MTINSGPFRIPEKCANCLSVRVCLEDFEDEQSKIIDSFKSSAGDLETAEMIYVADTPGSRISSEAQQEMVHKWRAASVKLGELTLQTQAIFDDIEAKCPGLAADGDCTYPDS